MFFCLCVIQIVLRKVNSLKALVMGLFSSAINFIFSIIFSIFAWIFIRRPADRYGKLQFPPGPPLRFPIVGHLPLVGLKPHLKFLKWRKIYGDIIGVQLGSFKTVVINDYKLIKEAFNEPNFCGRPQLSVFNDQTGIISSDGVCWKEQRSFFEKEIKDLKFMKSTLESIVLVEINELISNLVKTAGRPIAIRRPISLAVLNVLVQIVCGERFRHNDPRLTDLFSKITHTFQNTPGNTAKILIPWLAKIAPRLRGWEKIVTATMTAGTYYTTQVDIHKETYQEGVRRDLVDVYLAEIGKTVNENSSFYKQEGAVQLKAVMNDVFVAGSETTSITLTWALLYISSHPEIQHKIHKEIDEVIGDSRLPSLSDREKMPYIQAVILETLRMSTITPLGAFHFTMEDTTFHGYLIEKGTCISANMWAAHHDPKLWGDPDNFRPERYISPDGHFHKHEAIISFSVGKRSCLGESLAMDKLFLFLTSIYQRFRTQLNPNEPKPKLTPTLSVFLIPRPYTIVLTDRFCKT